MDSAVEESPAGLTVRKAASSDLPSIREIYNQGVQDGIATLDTHEKSASDIVSWYEEHNDRYGIVVAEGTDGAIHGWAALNRYSHKAASDIDYYFGVADLSIYVSRSSRGQGVGKRLLRALEAHAQENGFHKVILFALERNASGQHLYRSAGFREVGIFERQGILRGEFADVIIMEKLL